MPATQDPRITLPNFLIEVRNYLRDYPELNRLVDGEETSDRQLRWFVAEVLDDFATTPPLIGFIPFARFPSRSLLLKGVLAETLRSVSVLNLRNALRYTDGQVQVDLDKHGEQLRLSQVFSDEYETKKLRLKMAMNLQRSMRGGRGLHSEYYYIAGYYTLANA